jgi:hypothetical protein
MYAVLASVYCFGSVLFCFLLTSFMSDCLYNRICGPTKRYGMYVVENSCFVFFNRKVHYRFYNSLLLSLAMSPNSAVHTRISGSKILVLYSHLHPGLQSVMFFILLSDECRMSLVLFNFVIRIRFGDEYKT